MAITRITAPSITGLVIPNTSINNASLDSVTSLPSGIDVGKVGQVVQTIKTDIQTIGSTSYVNIMSVNITPTNTSNKVLLMWNLQCNANDHFELSIFRDATQIYLGDASSSRTRNAHSSYAEATNSILSYSGNYLDSPSSISEQTYYIKGRSSASATYQIFVNRSVIDTDRIENGRTASDITVTEILA
jgi:hypothetical protein